MLLIEVEAAVDDQVGADQDGAVALSWRWCGSRSIRLSPGHHLQVKLVHIVEEVRAVPSAEDDHLGAIDEVGGMVETRSGRTTTLWTLEPSHGEWVKSMQVSEDGLGTLASEDDYSSASQDSGVTVP